MGLTLDKLINFETNMSKLKNPFEKWRLINVGGEPIPSKNLIAIYQKAHSTQQLVTRKMKRSTTSNGSKYQSTHMMMFGHRHLVKNGFPQEAAITSAAYTLGTAASKMNNISSTVMHAHHSHRSHHHDNGHEHNHRVGTIMLGKRFAHFAIPSALTFFSFALVCGIIFCIFEKRRRRLQLTSRHNQQRQAGIPHKLDKDKQGEKIADAQQVIPPESIPSPSEPRAIKNDDSRSRTDILKLRRTLEKIIGHFFQKQHVSKMYTVNGDLNGLTLKMDRDGIGKEKIVKTMMTSRVISFSGTCADDNGFMVNKEVELGMSTEKDEDFLLLYNSSNWHPQQQHTCISIV